MSTYAKLIGASIVSAVMTLPAFGLDTFGTEMQAQQHCPRNSAQLADHDLALQGAALVCEDPIWRRYPITTP